MSSIDPQPTSTQSSSNAIFIRAAVVLVLLGAGGWYAYWMYTRPPLRKVLGDGEIALMKQDLALAEKIGREALSRAPRAPETKVYLAQVHVAKKEYAQALELLKQVPDGTRDTPSARAIQGSIVMTQHGDLEEAEKLFKETLEQDPNHSYAMMNYSSLLRVAIRNQERTQIDLKLIQERSVTPVVLYHLVLNWNLHTPYRMTSELFAKNPDDYCLQMGMADGALAERRFDEAEKYLRSAITKAPQSIDGHYLLGRVLFEKGDTAKLVEWNQQLPSGADAHPGIWQVRGKWGQLRGDLPGAARCYWEAAKLDPNYSEACYHLGQALVQLQRVAAGKPFMDRAKAIDSYTARVQSVNSVGRGTPDFKTIRPILDEAMSLGLYWEALGWAILILEIKDDEGVKKIGNQLAEAVEGEALQRSFSKANIALKIDLGEYPVPDWGKLEAAAVQTEAPKEELPAATISFEDRAKSIGIDFQYFNGADKRLRGLGHSYEFTGGGVAVLDYDQDGLPDFYFTQGGSYPTDEKSSAHTDRLYRNLGHGKFEDVTTTAGISENRYSQGVGSGDINNDGYPDLYVGNLGHNRLYLNNGDGTFEDVTARASVAGANVWTTSCAIADVNGDQLPDIYSVNYLGDEAVKTVCRTADSGKKLHACVPKQFPSEDDQLFLNLGDGRFRNVSRDAGILLPDGKGLGIVVGDLMGRGSNGLFIANDSTANYMLVNSSGPGAPPRFVDQGLISGLAFNQAGSAQACMGVAVDDFDRNGLIDLFVTNFTEEGSTLYSQDSAGIFLDQSHNSGLYDPTVRFLGFGTQSIDADLDGWSDLIQTNGHIDTYESLPFEYEMSPQFFRNVGKGKFKELPASVLGPFFSGKYLGRGMARVDWNQDGLEDVVISHLDVPAAVLTNTTKTEGHFLALSLRGVASARDAIGAVVKVKVGETTLMRHLTGGDGYQASNERALYFGLGNKEEVDAIEIRWPSGAVQTVSRQRSGQSLRILEGVEEPVVMW